MRIRHRVDHGPGWSREYWSKVSDRWSVNPVNAPPRPPRVVSLEYMQDSLHDVKRLGKTLNDIGGDLDHLKIDVTLDGWTPVKSYIGAGNSATHDVFIPFVGNAGGGNQHFAEDVLRLLRDCTTAYYGTGVTRTFVQSKIASLVTSYLGHSDLDSLGASLVNAVRPTNPSVDTATAVAELVNEGRFFSLTPDSSLSGNYLNYSFGIAPTVSLVQDFQDAARNADAILQQYERDAGRLVRRRYDLPPVVSSQQGTSGLWTQWTKPEDSDEGLTYQISGNWDWRYKLVTKQAFSGAFTYPRPPEGWRRTLAELEHLYGIKPGIDTAWELIPFSFVADYFSNAGHVLSNINAMAADGLVMPYGYVMETRKFSWEYSGTMSYKEVPGGATKKTPVSMEIHVESRKRRRANPFGFGFDLELTPRQLSILAALGIQFLT